MSKFVGVVIVVAGLACGVYFLTKQRVEHPVASQIRSDVPKKTPRFIGLNGTITETLFALGVGAQVVGRDTSSYYPREVLKLPTVGYQHRLSAEGILRLRPTLVIGLKGVKPTSVLAQIKGAGVKVLLLPKPTNITLCKEMISSLGKALGRAKEARLLLARIDRQLAKLASLRKAWKGKSPRAVALYVRGNRMRFVLGRKTTVGGMLELIGAVSAVNFARVKPISAEAMVSAKPEVIVALSKGVTSIGGRDKLIELPGVALTPAGKHKRFVVMDDLFLGGFGPRAGLAAIALFYAVFHGKAQ